MVNRLIRRLTAPVVPFAFACSIAACSSDYTPVTGIPVDSGLRIVNAFTTPVDVLIDGAVAIPSLAAGSVGFAQPASGSHTLIFRPTAASGSAPQTITTTSGALNTFVAVRGANGVVSTVALDDTGSVVPAGATKVRVLHLAPNAGELQVYRTQPDFQQPISWQFPFTYQSQPDPLSAPFFQSTVGIWDVRVWQTPADSTGWAGAPLRLVIQLYSGEKLTILILDKQGGGVRAELI
jgi:hypothetical protein